MSWSGRYCINPRRSCTCRQPHLEDIPNATTVRMRSAKTREWIDWRLAIGNPVLKLARGSFELGLQPGEIVVAFPREPNSPYKGYIHVAPLFASALPHRMDRKKFPALARKIRSHYSDLDIVAHPDAYMHQALELMARRVLTQGAYSRDREAALRRYG